MEETAVERLENRPCVKCVTAGDAAGCTARFWEEDHARAMRDGAAMSERA